MYYKINSYGDEKYTDIGMLEVTASFFLELGDKGYDKFAAEHVSGSVVTPFRNHSMRFESSSTQEDIDAYFENISGLLRDAYLDDDIRTLKNDVSDEASLYEPRKKLYDTYRAMPEEERTDYIKAKLAKVTEAEEKIRLLEGVGVEVL